MYQIHGVRFGEPTPVLRRVFYLFGHALGHSLGHLLGSRHFRVVARGASLAGKAFLAVRPQGVDCQAGACTLHQTAKGFPLRPLRPLRHPFVVLRARRSPGAVGAGRRGIADSLTAD
jgi:hypothetical protein